MTTINPKSVAEHSAPFVLDVRTPVEYRAAHAPGSVLMPLHQLDPAKVREMAAGKTCFVMCRSGHRATEAAHQLLAAGLSDVRVIEGGLLAWEKAGLPVTHGAACISVDRQVRIVAGFMALAGAVLALTVNPYWVILSGFVGCGLLVAGITEWCPLALLLARMPWNNNVTESQGSCCAAR